MYGTSVSLLSFLLTRGSSWVNVCDCVGSLSIASPMAKQARMRVSENEGEGEGEGHSLFCGVSRNSIDCVDSMESFIPLYPFPKVDHGFSWGRKRSESES